MARQQIAKYAQLQLAALHLLRCHHSPTVIDRIRLQLQEHHQGIRQTLNLVLQRPYIQLITGKAQLARNFEFQQQPLCRIQRLGLNQGQNPRLNRLYRLSRLRFIHQAPCRTLPIILH